MDESRKALLEDLAARLSAESARLAGLRSVSPVGNAGRLIGGHEMTKEAERQ